MVLCVIVVNAAARSMFPSDVAVEATCRHV